MALILKGDTASHWYDKSGNPVHTVIGKNGKERNTTLRDARELGLLPSVTNILGVMAKDALNNWKEAQTIQACFDTPPAPGEPVEVWAERVREIAGTKLETARTFGKAIHSACESINLGKVPQVQPEHYHFVEHYQDWFKNIGEVIFAEKVLVGDGWAGTTDMIAVHKTHGLVVVDFKTQGIKEGKKPTFYESWIAQLAAYQTAACSLLAGQGTPKCLSLAINSTRPEPCVEKLWTDEEANSGWQLFTACKQIWRITKDYYPG